MNSPDKIQEIVIVGGGVMGTTLAVMMERLMPDAKISIFEQLGDVAEESSKAWNNAGTGHSAFCELNYTPEKEDGSLDIDKALEIASSFEVSRQFWSFLKEQGVAKENFINTVPHMSFVWGEHNKDFLKKRIEALTPYALFEDMKYSEDFDKIASWVPIMMKDRDKSEVIGATRMQAGTDVNYGVITHGMMDYLKTRDNVSLHLNHDVNKLKQQKDGSWKIKVKDKKSGETKELNAQFVYIAAGGKSLPLLQKTGIKEGKGYGGFPVGGKFLRCTNPDVIKKHKAKAYGKAAAGSPPMSMPHLDERKIDGKDSILFGPFAGFSLKFIKSGSILDLIRSLRFHNVLPMLAVGVHELGLIKYLAQQLTQTKQSRFNFLKLYFPTAEKDNWELYEAGIRVQIMKKDKKKGGVLKFGTEIITSEDGTIAALLGASPGASTAVCTSMEILEKCFPEQIASEEWKTCIAKMIPTYGKSLIDDADLCRETRKRTATILGLEL